MRFLDDWRRRTQSLDEVRRVNRGLLIRERWRLGRLALSGEEITDPKDAPAVEVLTRAGYALILSERVLKVSLAVWVGMLVVVVTVNAIRGHWGDLVINTLLFGPILVLGLLSVRWKRWYRATAEVNGWEFGAEGRGLALDAVEVGEGRSLHGTARVRERPDVLLEPGVLFLCQRSL
jgi:hypothetical protein